MSGRIKKHQMFLSLTLNTHVERQTLRIIFAQLYTQPRIDLLHFFAFFVYWKKTIRKMYDNFTAINVRTKICCVHKY